MTHGPCDVLQLLWDGSETVITGVTSSLDLQSDRLRLPLSAVLFSVLPWGFHYSEGDQANTAYSFSYPISSPRLHFVFAEDTEGLIFWSICVAN